jgi:hypothetical protein
MSFVLGEKSFAIDSDEVFSANSGRYRLLLQFFPGSPHIDLPHSIDPDSAVQFVASCHNQEPVFSESNLLDCYRLADDWDCPTFKDQISNFASENSTRLLALLVWSVQESRETSSLEGWLRSRFGFYASDPALLQLPLSLLVRTFSPTFDHAFQFAVSCLNQFGSSASILFSDIDLTRASRDELQKLLKNSDFLWSFANRPLAERLVQELARPPRALPPRGRSMSPKSMSGSLVTDGTRIPGSWESAVQSINSRLSHMDDYAREYRPQLEKVAKALDDSMAKLQRDRVDSIDAMVAQLHKCSEDVMELCAWQMEHEQRQRKLEIELDSLDAAECESLGDSLERLARLEEGFQTASDVMDPKGWLDLFEGLPTREQLHSELASVANETTQLLGRFTIG